MERGEGESGILVVVGPFGNVFAGAATLTRLSGSPGFPGFPPSVTPALSSFGNVFFRPLP